MTDPALTAVMAGSAATLDPPVDFFDPAFQREPFEGYRRLRGEAPVLWDDALQCYVISRHATISAVAADTETFSNIGCMDVYFDSPVAAEVAAIRASTWPTPPMIVTNDPPSHTIYRRISNRILSPRMMRDCRDMIEAEVNSLLDGLLATGGGDVVARFCIPLPVAVIATLMGFPREAWGKVKQWSDAYTDPLTGMISPERELECAHLYVERQNYFAERITERRAAAAPPDDIITGVALARLDDGTPIPMAEALAMLEQFMVAGNETTTSALSMGLLIMAQRPDLVAQMRADAERIPVFTEEMLRLYAPSQGQLRIVTRDTSIEGVPIRAGQKVMLRWGAANRDEDVFADGEQVDLNRTNAHRHLSFGHGIHTCQGAPLARIEMNAAYRAFSQRANIAVDTSLGAIEHALGVVFMAMKSLPLSVTEQVR